MDVEEGFCFGDEDSAASLNFILNRFTKIIFYMQSLLHNSYKINSKGKFDLARN